MEIGIDCVDISRFDESSMLIKHSLRRIFTEKEIRYCQGMENASQHFAVRFAGKEAIIKALSDYNIEFSLNQIEILNKPNGKPIVKILSDSVNGFNIKISLSHSKTTAVAIAFISTK